MVKSFTQLASHRQYVLFLYRSTLRDIKNYSSSIRLHSRTKHVVKAVLKRHKCDQSSWSVYTLLQDLNKLNHYICKQDIKAASELLGSYQKLGGRRKKSPLAADLRDIHQTVKRGLVMPQDHEKVRESNILSRYVHHRQAQNLLPKHIAKIHKEQILLPLALHEYALQKLNRIHSTLKKGPPKVYLAHAAAGPVTVYFVRSALNKRKRQSRKLSSLFRQEKVKSQYILNTLYKCRKSAFWALNEAVWEEYIENNDATKFSNIAKYFRIGNFDKFEPLSEDLVGKSAILNASPKVQEWLNPIMESWWFLKNKADKKVVYFQKYKDRLVSENSPLTYFTEKSDRMYQRRLNRFNTMATKDLPHVNPFIKGQTLPEVLKKNLF